MKKIILLLMFLCSVASAQTFHINTLVVDSNTNSSSSSTGAATIVGGLGVGGNLYAGGSINGGAFSATGLTVTTNGVNITGGAIVAGGMTISSGSLSAIGAVFSGAVGVNSLSTTTSATIGNSLTVSAGGASVAGGINVSSGGVGITGGLTMNSGAITALNGSYSTGLTVPTLAIGNNSTNVASTAFVAKRGCPNIMDYGGDNTGTNNNDTPWTNTLAAAPNTAQQACIYFPTGKFKFAGAISYTLPASGIGSVMVMGNGLDNTILYWPSGNGMTINFPTGRVSAHVRDLSITTGTTNTGVGLAYTQSGSIADPSSTPGSSIINVAIHGDDGYVGGAYADYWQYGVNINGVTYVAAYNLNTAGTPAHVGTGMIIQGTAGTSYAAATAITSSNFESQNVGILYGNYVQGVTVFQSSFAGDNIGIQAAASETGILDGLLVTGSEFATHQFGILTSTAIGNTQIVGNAFQNLNASGVNVDLNLSNVFVVVGNIIECGLVTGPTYGFIAATSSGGGLVSGNEFSLCGVGVNLGAGTSTINVQSNYYIANTSNTANAGTGNTIGGGSP